MKLENGELQLGRARGSTDYEAASNNRANLMAVFAERYAGALTAEDVEDWIVGSLQEAETH